VLTIGKLAFQAMGADSHLSGLGCWPWARYHGGNGENFCAVSIYRPTLNPTGCQSVWAQHKAYFQSINDDRDPGKAFMEDLEKEDKEWLATGDHIVIGGDVNDDIFGGDIIKLFENELHMKDLIYTRHPKKMLQQLTQGITITKPSMYCGALNQSKYTNAATLKLMPSFPVIMQPFGPTSILTLHLVALFKNLPLLKRDA
jgi:hypothetical protein